MNCAGSDFGLQILLVGTAEDFDCLPQFRSFNATSASQFLHLAMSWTTKFVIVDQADCLHPCIDDRGTDELESSLLQVLGQRFGSLGLCRCAAVVFPLVDDRFSIHPLPTVFRKVLASVGHGKKRLRIADRRDYFLLTANDARVLHRQVDPSLVPTRYGLRIKLIEFCANRRSLS